jgi:hypothetical protein
MIDYLQMIAATNRHKILLNNFYKMERLTTKLPMIVVTNHRCSLSNAQDNGAILNLLQTLFLDL